MDHKTHAIRTHIGPIVIFKSGLSTIKTPKNPTIIALHLLIPTTSLNTNIASKVAKIGIVNAKD